MTKSYGRVNIRVMGRNTIAKVDHDEAQRMLDDGASVLEIARRFGVSPQTIYDAMKRGRLVKPAAAPA